MDLKAVFVDAAGTLLRPREPVGVTYARYARARGLDLDPAAVDLRFRRAMRVARGEQVGDGQVFWRPVVAAALEVDDERLFQDVYRHYAEPRAWWIDTDALSVLAELARSGLRLGIISNFDTRLRELYNRLALDRLFSVLVCSAEVEVEKPDPWIFHIACRVAGVSPAAALHIGDDPERDVEGATQAGLSALQYDDDEGWTAIGEQIKVLRRPIGLFGLAGRR